MEGERGPMYRYQGKVLHTRGNDIQPFPLIWPQERGQQDVECLLSLSVPGAGTTEHLNMWKASDVKDSQIKKQREYRKQTE